MLAGLHNNLRSQTQIRLEEGFLGYDDSPGPEAHKKLIGVGEINAEPGLAPNSATNRLDKGDFTTKAAAHLAVSPEQRPWLFAVKKNGGVLRLLHRWITKQAADEVQVGRGGRKRLIATKFPLLMIDDEADHASVDSGAQYYDESGRPDENYAPKVINSWIRKILVSFSRSAYVGYTATPFANIFIHEKGSAEEEGPDLFPSAFIMNMATPLSHVGPDKIFGTSDDDGQVLPLTRIIDDGPTRPGFPDPALWPPNKHNGRHRLPEGPEGRLPEPLEEAISSFILAGAVRALRGQGREHCSMLIHLTRYTDVQKHIHQQVEAFLNQLRRKIIRRIGADELWSRFERLRHDPETGFAAVNKMIRAREGRAGEPRRGLPELPPFQDAVEIVPEIVSELKVKSVNGASKDALDYEAYKEIGLKAVIIGGDKLSRGLTLHGLTTSCFQRASKMYDTLMQMGRWFGYRPGYLDLCRLYTTRETMIWQRHITEADRELRAEFGRALEAGLPPRQYGLKVKTHPDMLVTSRVKMRHAKKIELTFSGHTFSGHKRETVSFFPTPVVWKKIWPPRRPWPAAWGRRRKKRSSEAGRARPSAGPILFYGRTRARNWLWIFCAITKPIPRPIKRTTTYWPILS